MLNLDSRLLKHVDTCELHLLVILADYMNARREAWPSNTTLMAATGWKIEKLQNVKKSLVNKNLIRVILRRSGKRQTSNCYIIQTPLIGKFNLKTDVGKSGIGFSGMQENPTPPIQENPTPPDVGKSYNRSITQKEVLLNELNSQKQIFDFWWNGLLKDENFMESLKLAHPGKDIEQAARQAHIKLLVKKRILNFELDEFKSYLNTWLANASTQQKEERKPDKYANLTPKEYGTLGGRRIKDNIILNR